MKGHSSARLWLLALCRQLCSSAEEIPADADPRIRDGCMGSQEHLRASSTQLLVELNVWSPSAQQSGSRNKTTEYQW